jgi:hypothetical protein
MIEVEEHVPENLQVRIRMGIIFLLDSFGYLYIASQVILKMNHPNIKKASYD